LFVLLPLSAALLWILALRRKSSQHITASTEGSRSATEDAVHRSPSLSRLWLCMALSLLVGVLVINAGYLFGGALTPLGHFQFESQQMQTLTAWMPAWLPVPLPQFFFQGIDVQFAESGYTAYLIGEFNDTGFYSYYLVALLVKTPAPVLLLCGLAWFCRGRITRREVPLIVTAALLLLFFSISRHKNIGLRYVLFLEPMMAVWISRLVGGQRGQEPFAGIPARRDRVLCTKRSCPLFPARFGLGIAACCACLIAITLTSWPHYLPYFNWLSGGPNNGHRWLLDSNLDWGQDLIALRRYMEREQIEEIDLAYFGRVPPAAYGIRHRTLRAGERPVNRHVAISANLLWGLMYIVNGDLNYWPDGADSYAAFRSLRPKAILGHSIYVFDEGQPQ
jgi:hypothetical protein